MKNILFTTFLLFCTVATKAQCHIYDLVATHSDCNNGQFYVTINFQYSGVGNQGFKVQGNGNNYGTFEYANLPITLGPLAMAARSMSLWPVTFNFQIAQILMW
jgi:hypothetical protein